MGTVGGRQPSQQQTDNQEGAGGADCGGGGNAPPSCSENSLKILCECIRPPALYSSRPPHHFCACVRSTLQCLKLMPNFQPLGRTLFLLLMKFCCYCNWRAVYASCYAARHTAMRLLTEPSGLVSSDDILQLYTFGAALHHWPSKPKNKT